MAKKIDELKEELIDRIVRRMQHIQNRLEEMDNNLVRKDWMELKFDGITIKDLAEDIAVYAWMLNFVEALEHGDKK